MFASWCFSLSLLYVPVCIYSYDCPTALSKLKPEFLYWSLEMLFFELLIKMNRKEGIERNTCEHVIWVYIFDIWVVWQPSIQCQDHTWWVKGQIQHAFVGVCVGWRGTFLVDWNVLLLFFKFLVQKKTFSFSFLFILS